MARRRICPVAPISSRAPMAAPSRRGRNELTAWRSRAGAWAAAGAKRARVCPHVAPILHFPTWDPKAEGPHFPSPAPCPPPHILFSVFLRQAEVLLFSVFLRQAEVFLPKIYTPHCTVLVRSPLPRPHCTVLVRSPLPRPTLLSYSKSNLDAASSFASNRPIFPSFSFAAKLRPMASRYSLLAVQRCPPKDMSCEPPLTRSPTEWLFL